MGPVNWPSGYGQSRLRLSVKSQAHAARLGGASSRCPAVARQAPAQRRQCCLRAGRCLRLAGRYSSQTRTWRAIASGVDRRVGRGSIASSARATAIMETGYHIRVGKKCTVQDQLHAMPTPRGYHTWRRAMHRRGRARQSFFREQLLQTSAHERRGLTNSQESAVPSEHLEGKSRKENPVSRAAGWSSGAEQKGRREHERATGRSGRAARL